MSTKERIRQEHDDALNSLTDDQRRAISRRERSRRLTHFWGGTPESCLERIIGEEARAEDAAIERSRSMERLPVKAAA